MKSTEKFTERLNLAHARLGAISDGLKKLDKDIGARLDGAVADVGGMLVTIARRIDELESRIVKLEARGRQ